MKIGILTFHAEFNYGSVLQALALSRVIENMGHHVCFLNHQVLKDNIRLKSPFNGFSIKGKIFLLIKALLGAGVFRTWIRRRRSIAFIKKWFKVTPYEFFEWSEAPNDLGVDMIVVGSDQLWSPQWCSPRHYLLEGAPDIKAITYGVSIGVSEIPESYKSLFVNNLPRFSAVSMRENIGVDIVKKLCPALDPLHVIDPTLLIDKQFWNDFVSPMPSGEGKKKIVCYFMADYIEQNVDLLINYSRSNDMQIDIFTDHFLWRRPTLKEIRLLLSGVKIHFSADAQDFVKAISTATTVISDSFHALMFSLIFNKQIKVLRPTGSYRGDMFSRINEAVDEFTCGDVFCSSLEEALKGADGAVSFRNDVIEKRRNESMNWLVNAIKGQGKSVGE